MIKRMHFYFWMKFNGRKICQALLENKIKPTSCRNVNYDRMLWIWDLLCYKHHTMTEEGAIVTAGIADTRANWLLDREDAFEYKKYIAYKILKGDVEQ